jgi:hypothetical protein
VFTLTLGSDEEENEYAHSESSSSSEDTPAITISPANESDAPDDHRQLPKIVTTVQPKAPAPPLIENGALLSDSNKVWHVFTLLATSPTKNTANGSASSTVPALSATTVLTVDEKVLKDDIDEIDRYLSFANRRQGEASAYLTCSTKTMSEVKDYIYTLDATPANDHSSLNHSRVHLFKAAENIFTFFYPPTYEHTVTLKFWGAVDSMLVDEQAAKSPSRFRYTVRNLQHLSHIITDLKEELFSKRTPAYNQTNVPHEFIQAWLMGLMYFVLFTTPEAQRSASYLQRCRALLTQGKLKVIQRLQTVSLKDREAAQPLGVVSILIGQLLQDAKGGPIFTNSHRLASLYWADLNKLVSFTAFQVWPCVLMC